VSVEDRQLINECLQGRLEAFSELVRRYQDRLYNAVFRFLNDAEDAQDVTQEAFLSAWQALSRFKGDAKFFTWIYRIAINHAIDLKRKQKISQGLEVHLNDEIQPVATSTSNRPEDAAERREEGEKLRKALNLLSPEHRMVLILKDIDGMKYEEMADTLEVPIGTIRSRLHRARFELRDILERQEEQSVTGREGAC
jgi:RNA polymerase sigma-70 factor, ECF subfamily